MANLNKISRTPLPNVHAITFILTVVLLLPLAPCLEDAVFCCERESTLFRLPKEDTTRNQWLNCIYNTVPEQFNPNIRVCALCNAFYGGLFPEPGRVTLQCYNAGLQKGCFYKVGQLQLYKDSLTPLTHSL